MHHSCKELIIPISWGNLAGKLWTPLTPSIHEYGGIALHGVLDNAASFDPLIPYLPHDLTLLALDLPGHGYSDHYNEGVEYYWTRLVSDILEVLRYLSWHRPVLIGHSLGGFLAIAVASILQNEIGKLVILDGMYPELFITTDNEFIGYMKRNYYELGIGARLRKIRLYTSRIDLAKSILRRNTHLDNLTSAEILATRGCKEVEGGVVFSYDRRFITHIYNYLIVTYWSFMGQSLYDRLTMPTLYINGKNSPLKSEEWMKRDDIKLSPTSHIINVDGGHMVHMEAPDRVGKVMKEFITQKFNSKL